jgi:hypothetical protein
MVRLFDGQHICPVWWKSFSTYDLYSSWYNWSSATHHFVSSRLWAYFSGVLHLFANVSQSNVVERSYSVDPHIPKLLKSDIGTLLQIATVFTCTHDNIATMSFVTPRPRWRDVLTGTPPKNHWLVTSI